MDRFEAYYSETAALRAIERALINEWARNPAAMAPREVEAFRFGFALARVELIRTLHGDVDLFLRVAPFRHWFAEQLGHFVDPDARRPLDWAALRRLAPTVLRQVIDARAGILDHEANHIAASRLDRELSRRQLALVMGGGGGAGYAHLGALDLLDRLGYQPALIAGSSMGSLLGLCRSSQLAWDRDAILSILPKPADVADALGPYRGYSRFCFPGALEIRARSFGENVFQRLFGRDIPRISELPIRYYPVATGLRTGIGLALSEVEDRISRIQRSTRLSRAQQRIMLFASVMRIMASNPRFLEVVPFGQHPALRDFDAIDAMGFSCAVPGVLHYDIFTHRHGSIDALRTVFDEYRLFRLTDGGVVSNVPSRVAARAVWDGDLGVRNAFVLALDCFAPLLNQNAIFTPVQQFARVGVMASRPYSDLHITWRNPPSPIGVMQTRPALEKILDRSFAEVEKYGPRIDLALRPLPPLAELADGFGVPRPDPVES